MALTDNYKPLKYIGDGSQMIFPVVWKVVNPASVLAFIYDTKDTLIRQLESNIDFTFVADKEPGVGGAVHLAVAPTLDERLVIVREEEYTQPLVLTNNQRIDVTTLEMTLDHIVMLTQQNRDMAQRAIRVPPGSDSPPELLAEQLFEARDQTIENAAAAADSAAAAADSATAAQAALADVVQERADAIANIQAEVANGISTIGTETISSIGLITAAGDSQVERVVSEGDNQIALVAAEGAIQIAKVQQAGTDATASVEAATVLGTAEADRAKAEADRAKAEADRAAAIVDLGPATTTNLGLVIVGDGLGIEEDGTLHTDIPIASDSELGLVKVGAGLNIDSNGVLSGIVPEIQPTAEIYISGEEVGGIIPLDPIKPVENISIPWIITTGNTQKTFRYVFQEDGTISSLSRYRLVLYLDSVETSRDYTFSGTIVANVAGQDILISGNLYTTRFAVSNPRAEIPLENNVLPTNIRRSAGDYFEIILNVTKSSGGADTAFIRATPLLDSKLIRNGGEIGSNNVLDFNGVDTSTQAERNRYFEEQLMMVGGSKHLGEAYFYLGTDTPAGGLWYNSGATIPGADKLYPDVDGNIGFWSWLTGPKGASLRCTKAQQDAEIATYGVSGRIAIEGTTLYMPTGVPSFFALSGPDKTLMSVEHDTGRNVTGTIQHEVSLGFSKLDSKVSGCIEVINNNLGFRVGGVSPGDGAGPLQIDASRNWGAEHTGDRFKPVSINARCYIHTASFIVPPSTAQAAEIMSTALQAAADASVGKNFSERFTIPGAAPAYACRAWVNFNGTGTVSIRASGNVSSITDRGTGDYTINFATPMPDNKYSFSATSNSSDWPCFLSSVPADGSGVTLNSLRVQVFTPYPSSPGARDVTNVTVSIFR